MFGLIVILCLLAAGLAALFFWIDPLAPENREPPETPAYPFNSFAFVERRLPAAPMNYLWEHKVDRNHLDDVIQTLSVVRIADMKVMQSKSINLTSDRNWSWAQNQVDYPMIHNDCCKKNSLKLVSFAKDMASKYCIDPGEQQKFNLRA